VGALIRGARHLHWASAPQCIASRSGTMFSSSRCKRPTAFHASVLNWSRQGRGIGILEVVESDFAKNLAAEESEEASLLTAYEKNTQENKISTAKKNQDVTYKTQEYTGLDKAISELSSDRKTASTEQSAVLEYLDKLKDRCIAKPETYETRKDRREAEIAGLKEALSILEAEGSFVQRGAHRLGHRQRMRGSTLSARAAS